MNLNINRSGPKHFILCTQLAACMMGALMMISAAESADTKITDRETLVTETIPKPAHIWVYDFAATPGEVPAESALAEQASTDKTPQTDEQIAAGRKLGAELARELARQIDALGMPATQAGADTQPQLNDLVIHGYIISITEGDAKKRVGIGFGKGGSELQTAVEGFAVTASGLRKLGGGKLDAKGSKSPGAAAGAVGVIAMHNPLGLIVSAGKKSHDEKTGSSTVEGRARQTAQEIAAQLKPRFQAQGWIE
jgi:hypothetical protein